MAGKLEATEEPQNDGKIGGRTMNVRVLLLDDTLKSFNLPSKASGRVLFQRVCQHLGLLETDYFDLEFNDLLNKTVWIDHEKAIHKLFGSSNPICKFVVKFYPADASSLEDELTRYMFALQCKRDLASGILVCSETSAVLLASYIVQAEKGDYNDSECLSGMYIQEMQLLPQQTPQIVQRIQQYHKMHIGMTPAMADMNLLDTARKVDLYGIKMHPARDYDSASLNLAVSSMGVLIYQGYTKINTFSWAKIRKLSFKRKKFLIKLHPEGFGFYKDTVEFQFRTRDDCKAFWKKCIEHHAFFRCQTVKPTPKRHRLMSRGSSFRYSGRTQKQLKDDVRVSLLKRHDTPMDRSRSYRLPGNRDATQSLSRGITASPVAAANMSLLSSGSHTLDRSGVDPMTRSALVNSTFRSSGPSPRRVAPSQLCLDVPNHVESTGHLTPQSVLTPNDVRLGVPIGISPDGGVPPGMSPVGGLPHDVARVQPFRPVSPSQSHRSVEAHAAHEQRVRQTPPAPHVYDKPTSTRQVMPARYSPAVGPSSNSHSPAVSGSPAVSPGVKAFHYPPLPEQQPQPKLTSFPRKASEPVFSRLHQQEVLEAQGLERTSELENIPDKIRYDLQPSHLDRSNEVEDLHMRRSTEQLPAELLPPPPPLTEEEEEPESYTDQPITIETNGEAMNASSEVSAVSPSISTSSPIQRDQPLPNGNRLSENNVSPLPSPPAPISAVQEVMSVTKPVQDDSSGRVKRQDACFYLGKELLMTERTYKKDLDVLCVWLPKHMDWWLRSSLSEDEVMPEYLTHILFSQLDPIRDFHAQFLQLLEQRLAMWEGKSSMSGSNDGHKLGDLMTTFLSNLKLYVEYIERHEEIVSELEQAVSRNRLFEKAYRDFELQKVCYIPVNSLLLKPAHRLLHYKLLLERIVQCYQPNHPDYRECKVALARISEVCRSVMSRITSLENLQKLVELQRDMVGNVDLLLESQRQFIREGCLQKFSRRGYQQRMFFLFSDMLIYCSRTANPTLMFKVHGQFALRDMVVDETDPKMAVANSFTIYAPNRCLLVAASSIEEKSKWVEDLKEAIAGASDMNEETVRSLTLRSNSSSENISDQESTQQGAEKSIGHRNNTTMHVCWHRNTSVSFADLLNAAQNQLSGYLLRKFKNSNGWQKLWVVFTSFCLFFYKSYQDDFPLASLPLLGYAVGPPTAEDGITKDYVFKLQFKNHVYFFRAESQATYDRWLQVISSATSSSHMTRMFSRTDSNTAAQIDAE